MSKEKVKKPKKMDRELYEIKLLRLQAELVEIQKWVEPTGARVVVIFEGRDAAGKGGMTERVTEYLNPRVAQMAAPSAPGKREENQWSFQCYTAHLPAADKVKLFDRSWYNRDDVEHVMSYYTADERRRSLRQYPIFGRMLAGDGTILLKYQFSASDKEQYKRSKLRITDPMRRWKLPPTGLEPIIRWEEHSRARDEMFVHTGIDIAPWNVVGSKDKRRARVSMIHCLLDSIPYKYAERSALEFLKWPSSNGYRCTDRALLHEVPGYASTLKASSEQKKYVNLEDEEILQGRISSI